MRFYCIFIYIYLLHDKKYFSIISCLNLPSIFCCIEGNILRGQYFARAILICMYHPLGGTPSSGTATSDIIDLGTFTSQLLTNYSLFFSEFYGVSGS